MNTLWESFESWLKIHCTECLSQLKPPATSTEIEILEKHLHVTLPSDFIDFLKIHNGQIPDDFWLIKGSELLSSERIMDEWSVWNDLWLDNTFEENTTQRDNGVKDDWWNPKWIPFTYDGSGNHLCIDLDPASNGTYGQIIEMWHDDEYRPIVAKSFTQWFQTYTKELQNGKYYYDVEYCAIIEEEE
jgi:cell wall assembly regulator SMI1